MPVEYDDGVLERYVRSLDTVDLLFAPGEQWSYSGIGYVLWRTSWRRSPGRRLRPTSRRTLSTPWACPTRC